MVNMYEITTSHFGRAIIVTHEGQQAVEALAWQFAVCQVGGHPYSQENPRVGLNCCLLHYLEKNPTLKRYIGVLCQIDEHESEHLFMDFLGMVYRASTRNLAPYKDIFETLRYYGFSLPHTYTPDENKREIALEPSWWKFYGQVQERSVVIAVYDRPTPRAYFEFLCVKNGPVVSVSRKRGRVLKLWRAAKKQILSSHDEDGYHWRDTTFKQVTDSHLYRAVSDCASDVYDASESDFLQFLQTIPSSLSTKTPSAVDVRT